MTDDEMSCWSTAGTAQAQLLMVKLVVFTVEHRALISGQDGLTSGTGAMIGA